MITAHGILDLSAHKTNSAVYTDMIDYAGLSNALT